MKSEHHSETDRTYSAKRVGRPVRDKAEDRKEALVLLAIAVLFLANVILYLCHHYGLTSRSEAGARQPVAARVIVD
jgi:hypothetical protein